MTQTIDEIARELLARQYEGTEYAKVLRKGKSNKYLDGSDIKALAALTEALTRIEELEGAVNRLGSVEAMTTPFYRKDNSEGRELVARIDFARSFFLALPENIADKGHFSMETPDLAPPAILSKGIKE